MRNEDFQKKSLTMNTKFLAAYLEEKFLRISTAELTKYIKILCIKQYYKNETTLITS